MVAIFRLEITFGDMGLYWRKTDIGTFWARAETKIYE